MADGEKLESKGNSLWVEAMKDVVRQPSGEAENNSAENSAEKNAENAKEKKVEDIREEIQQIYKQKQEIAPRLEESSQEFLPATKTPKSENKILKAAKATAGVSIAGVSAIGLALAPVLLPAAIPLMLVGADMALHAVRGVNGSMFQVNHNHKIYQRLNPIPVLMKHRGESSGQIFQSEVEKLFDGLESGVEYSTKSQAMTALLLKRAADDGRISDFKKEPAGESRLLLEQLGTGNLKGFWDGVRGKKHRMYNILFKVKKGDNEKS